MFNIGIAAPIVLYLGLLVAKPNVSVESYPSIFEFTWQFMFTIFIDDFLFYWIHRIFHLPFFYKHIHKIHHE